MLFVGAGLVTLANSFALGPLGAAGVDVGRLRFVAGLSILSAVAVHEVPWRRLPARSSVLAAVLGLALLLASGAWAGYAATEQATVAYPAFFLLIFGWIGLVHPRGTAALFAPVAIAGCAWLTVTTAHVTVSFAGLFVAIGASVLISETIAWAMARSRRHADDLRLLVGSVIRPARSAESRRRRARSRRRRRERCCMPIESSWSCWNRASFLPTVCRHRSSSSR